MTSQHDKPKRWRPRFSIRTLVIVVTLACCYAACWGPTKKWGVEDVYRNFSCFHNVETKHVQPVIPLVLEVNPRFSGGAYSNGTLIGRGYVLWCFGCILPLPI